MKRVFTLLILIACSFTLIYAQIDNPGFEEWEDVGFGADIMEPVNWSSIKTSDGEDFINNAAPVVWERSEDAHSGNYSVKLFNVATFGIVAAGTIINGRIHSDFNPDLAYSFTEPSDSRWHTAINYRPDSLVVWLKFFPQGADSMQIQGLLHVGDATIPPTPENEGNWVGHAVVHIGETMDIWTRVSIPFNYFDNRIPDYILFTFNSGNGTTPVDGSYAFVDDVELIGEEQAIGDHNGSTGTIYFADNSLKFNEISNDFLKDASLEVFDLTGRSIFETKNIGSSVSLANVNYKQGIHLVKLITESESVVRKVYFY